VYNNRCTKIFFAFSFFRGLFFTSVHAAKLRQNRIWNQRSGVYMADTKTLIKQAYSAFNKRDIDGALALMTEDVSWPKASEGGRIVGKEEIRAYWTRQWREFDPCVEPLAITEVGGNKVRVRVHQVVKSLQGDLLSDSEVLHVFTVTAGLIAAMDLGDEADRTADPSAAFAHRS
jgi:hypothetical protein